MARKNVGLILDPATYAVMVVDYSHHEAHAGSAYKLSVSGTDIRDTILILTFTTPDTEKWLHMLVNVASSGSAILTVTRNGAFGGGGSANKAAINRNHNSDNESGVISEFGSVAGSMTTDATPTVDGTVIHEESMGAGKDKAAGESRDDGEMILKQNTRYEIKLVGDADNVVGSINLSWYEHTNKG